MQPIVSIRTRTQRAARIVDDRGIRAIAKFAVLEALPRSTVVGVRSPSGAPLSMRVGRGETDSQIFNEIFGGEYSFDYPRDVRVVFDVGANVGYSAVWFSEQYPDARIVSIEPDPRNFELLVKNTSTFRNVIPVHGAVMPTAGPVKIATQGTGNAGLRAIAEDPHRAEHSAVQGYSVRELMSAHQIHRIDILKMDIEGGERAILESSDAWFAEVRSIAIETHDRYEPGCSRAVLAATRGFQHTKVSGVLHFAAR